MQSIYNITTRNINGCISTTQIRMMKEFVYKKETDLFSLQEVANLHFSSIGDYTAYVNVGEAQRDIPVKEGTELNNTTRLPSGRGMVGFWRHIGSVNILYMRPQEHPHEESGRTSIKWTWHTYYAHFQILQAGILNVCYLQWTVSSEAQSLIIQRLCLIDVWTHSATRAVHTHYTPWSAARLDRFYVSANLIGNKVDVKTIAVAFTDHFAVCLRVKMDEPLVRSGRGLWKLNKQLLDDGNTDRRFQQEWTRWKQQQHQYPDTVIW
jgi:hypothetical protein